MFRVQVKPDLTGDDLEVAEASVDFAIQNCPVEGLLSTENGKSISLDDLQDLLDKVKRIEATPGANIGEEFESVLRSVIDYTSENCPVEGVASFHDGRPITGRSIMELREKLRSAG